MENVLEEFFIGENNIFSLEIVLGVCIKILASIFIFLVAKLLIKLGIKFVDNIMDKQKGKNIRRKNTLMLLLKSILKYVVYFFAIISILSLFGIPVTSLIAGAGILGIAIGFGGQDLVKDTINGFFILFEDQFAVGDYVEVAGKEGIVEELGLRTTTIRNFGGQIHIIPNGDITQVTNYSNSDMRVLVDVGISYEENIAKALEHLEILCRQIAEEKATILTEGPKVLGVQELADSSVVLRVLARVEPMEQWAMGRYLKQRIKEYFDENGIEIAYPHLVLLSKGDELNKQQLE